MEALDSQVYCPALRLKAGECDATIQLAPDVRPRILPLFVVPPPSESDTELGRVLAPTELVAVSARRLGRAWPLRPCLLDPKFLFDKLDTRSADVWLPDLFRLARWHSANPWLVADLSDLEQFMRNGAMAVLAASRVPFALRLGPDDIEEGSLATRVQQVLLSLVRKPSETLLILDFANSDFSDTAVVAEVLVAALQRVMSVGLWGQVIWQATSYPETNPAPSGDMIILPRGEWVSYRLARALDPAVKQHLMFGDFAADSAKFNFSASGGIPPIPHFRYSTEDKWLVSRGAKDGKLVAEMPKVAARITSSGLFAGRTFSRGDQYIFDVAHEMGTGSARIWRCANTVHHLTRVSADIGTLVGYGIAALPQPEAWEQASFDV